MIKANAQNLNNSLLSNNIVSLLGTLGFVLVSLMLLGGCESDDCINCLDLPPPVVPTGVHSISGDNEVIVQWYDISYHPYDGNFNDNVVSYFIYSRYYSDGDEYINDREFFYIGEVAWDSNFDPTSGLHWFSDSEALNGEQYEYAVAAVNSAGRESALSYELVTDAPLPHSLAPENLYDRGGAYPEWSAFDFSEIDFGRDQTRPDFNADIEVYFSAGVPYVQTVRNGVQVQDFGVFTDNAGYLIFEGVSWAPADGYSSTGVLELIAGHIYVVKLNEGSEGIHYAKFGVTEIGGGFVEIIWAYQTISGLPELSVPDEDSHSGNAPEIISL